MNIVETNLKFVGTRAKRTRTDYIVLHHADAQTASAKTINNWHINGNGWVGIGYHFVVRKNGTVERGWYEDQVGAHASGHNQYSIGVCFEGDYDVETKMPDAQRKAGIELVRWLKSKYGVTKVVGHRDVNQTACPGRYFPFNEIANASAARDGWVKEAGKWYYYQNGAALKNAWLQYNGKWCWFGSDGVAAQNAWRHLGKVGNSWRQTDRNGVGDWYWFDGSTYMVAKTCLNINGSWYAFDSRGRMLYDIPINETGSMNLS